jgi:hypothetical protein
LTSLQYRDQKSAATHEIESSVSAPKRLRLEKHGDEFYMWLGDEAAAQSWQFAGGSIKVPLATNFYVGIGVCAHNKDAVQQAAFSNLELKTGPGGRGKAAAIQHTADDSRWFDGRASQLRGAGPPGSAFVGQRRLISHRQNG